VSAIRDKCETVIALSLNHLEEDKYKDNLISVAYRSFLMMMVSNVASDTAQADLFVELDTYGCTAYDMSRIEELFFRGYDSAVKVLEEKGYERVLPREEIVFPKKKRLVEEVENYELVFRNTVKNGVSALKAIKKSARAKL
jgi:hypothetical protein